MKVDERTITLFSLAIFILSFIYAFLSGAQAQPMLYPTSDGTLFGNIISNTLRVVYAFVVSMLFFGFSAFLVMFWEGRVVGSAFSSGNAPFVALLLVIPVFVSVYSSVALGVAILNDYKGKGNVFGVLKRSAKLLALALALSVVLSFLGGV